MPTLALSFRGLAAATFLVSMQLSEPSLSAATFYYRVDALGTLGGSSSNAVAINNQGQVAGSAYTANFQSHAALFDGPSPTDLGTLDGTFSSAQGINNLGQVVGAAVSNAVNTTRATKFSGTGSGNIDLGTLGGTESWAFGINATGQMVGVSQINGGMITHATRFSGTGTGNFDLGTLGGDYSSALAINDRGQIVGYASPSNNLLYHATLFSGTGAGNIDLGTLGGSSSVATAINAQGEIVGYAFTAGDASGHATLFRTTGRGNVDLQTLDATYSKANAINTAGQIVGDVGYIDSTIVGFVYDHETMYDLNALIDPATGWKLSSATGINDAGQIVGSGTQYGRPIHAVLLTPLAALPTYRVQVGVVKKNDRATFTVTNLGTTTRSFRLSRTQQITNSYSGPKPSKPGRSVIVTDYRLNGESVGAALSAGNLVVTLPPGGEASIFVKADVRQGRTIHFKRTIRSTLAAIGVGTPAKSASASTTLIVRPGR